MTVTTAFDDEMFSNMEDTVSPSDSGGTEGNGTATLAQFISQPSQPESHYGTNDDDDLLSLDGNPPSVEDSGHGRRCTRSNSSGSLESRSSKSTKLSKKAVQPSLNPNQDDEGTTPANYTSKKSSASSKVTHKKISKKDFVSSNRNQPPRGSEDDTKTPTSLSRPSDLYRVPIPFSQDTLELVDSMNPVDWSDAFSSPFHRSLDKSSNSWSEFFDKFDTVSCAEKLQRFISCDLGSNTPLAFLGVDRRGKIRILHNLLVAPNTGNFVNPDPIFFGLSHCKFNSPPIWLDPEDVDALLLSVEYPDVPSAHEIMKFCCIDKNAPSSSKKSRAADTLPSFHFDTLRFGSLKKPTADLDEAATTFSLKGLFPLHPALSGLLLSHFDAQELNSSKLSAPFLASFIFKFLNDRWTMSTPQELQAKCTSVPMYHDLFKSSLPLFRFLWFAHHKRSYVEPIAIEVPPNSSEATTAFESYKFQLFPFLKTEPTSSSPQGILPPPVLDAPVAPPHGHPPTFENFRVNEHSAASHPISADTIYMTEKLTDKLSDAIAKHTSKMTREKEDEKKEIFKHTTHLRNAIVFGQVGPSSLELPSSPSEIATELFHQKSTHTLYSTIHARVFRKSDNACYILFGQCGVLQKFGLRWRGNDHPSGFSPFSFDPYCCSGPDSHLALDHDIQHAIYESSLRSDNGLSTKDMRDIFVNEKLFCPLTCDEYQTQLRSFYLFACAIWNNECFVALQLHKMVEHILSNRYIYRSSQAVDPTFLCRVLFSIDFAIQRFIDSYLEDAKCVEDIRCDRLEFHINKLCDKIESKEDICKMLPKFIESAIRAKAKTQHDFLKNSSASSSTSTNPKKRKASVEPDPSPPTVVRFDSPADWCIPADLQYSRVFPRSVLAKIPHMTADGVDRPFCNKLFTLKYCKNGNQCHFSHADPREHGKGPAMSSFYKKAFNDARNNS